MSQLSLDRHRANAVNPRVGQVTPNHRQVRFLPQNRLREIRHLPKADAHPRQVLLRAREQALNFLDIGGPVVVTGHPHAKPGLVRPVARRAQVRAVRRGAHRQHSRPVGAFPPVKQGDRGV